MVTLRLMPELEDSLRRIAGVRAVSVVTGPDARPTEIHVLTDHSKPAKQVVRDVQSLAMASHDLDIDHRIVSVVQIDDCLPHLTLDGIDSAGDADGPAATPRALVASVAQRISGSEAEATVVLRMGSDVFEGSETGSSSPGSRPRLVARAALRAVSELLGSPAEIEHAEIVHVGGRAVAVCLVEVQAPRIGEQLLSGSALVRGDEADAVARSVLDALNRRLAG